MESATDLAQCSWCGGDWNASDPDGLARHETNCAERIRCPRCGAQPRHPCWYPSGQTIRNGHHAVRERAPKW